MWLPLVLFFGIWWNAIMCSIALCNGNIDLYNAAFCGYFRMENLLRWLPRFKNKHRFILRFFMKNPSESNDEKYVEMAYKRLQNRGKEKV